MERYWAVVPAAGVSKRLGDRIPKQYWTVSGKTLLEYTLERLLHHPQIARVIVAISSEDHWWSALPIARHERIQVVIGGDTRMDSVERGLAALDTYVEQHEKVLVHDAARAALSERDLSNLIVRAGGDPVGGILAASVVDTIKWATTGHRVAYTVTREGMWRALTPQLFCLGDLQKGIARARALKIVATDEANVIELMGKHPIIVASQDPNPKLTHPDDWGYISYLLSGSMQEQVC